MTFDSNKRLAMIARVFDTGISIYAAPVGIGAAGVDPPPDDNEPRSLLVIEPYAPLPLPL